MIPEVSIVSASITNEIETKKRKITNKEKFEYDQLNKDIPQLEIKKKEFEEKLSSCSDHNELLKITEQLGKLMNDLDSKSERWLELGEIVEL